MVELKVLEGDAKTDITFSHNANFFLYTTLESARPIAQARGNAVPAPYPVLTGMPVAGMAYLDRPSPAGYFIFPDLSVRHEGKYRLSFNLFEELKEDKDSDSEPTAYTNPDHPNNNLLRSSPMAPQAHVHFRLEVKSEPFVVFSAKKFPGLAESTQLSRVVAEQGCRVRIRRDVRMRRRDTKSSKDYDEYDEDPAGYTRAERYVTPDMYSQQPPIPDRARSASNASVEAHTPYATIERRPSNQEIGYYHQAAHPPPPPPVQQSQPSTTAYSSHLSFGGSSTAIYHTPALPANNAPLHQSTTSYMPSSANYTYQPAPPARPVTTPQSYNYQPGQPYQQSQHPTSQPYMETAEYKAYRRTSGPPNPPPYPPQAQNVAPPIEARTSSSHQNYYPQTNTSTVPRASTPSSAQQLPPLKTIQPLTERKYEQPPSASTMVGPVSGTSSQPSWDTTSSPYAYSAPGTVSADTVSRTGKRSYGSVFDQSHIKQSFHSGMRPDISKQSQDIAQVQLEDGSLEDEDDLASFKLLSYRRADGRRQHKKCPSPISG